jgi:hypothetical protein
MTRPRGEVRHADAERTLRLFSQPDRLGFVPGRLGESAELGETHDQPAAIVGRCRCRESEILVDPGGRQRREVAASKLDRSLELAPEEVRLLEIGCGEDAKLQVLRRPCDRQCPVPARQRASSNSPSCE